jgi:hypothetical protein
VASEIRYFCNKISSIFIICCKFSNSVRSLRVVMLQNNSRVTKAKRGEI